MESQREYCRICYSERDRPILQLGGNELPIVNLSETGACCLCNAILFADALAIPVEVRLAKGRCISTTAAFIRQEPDRLAVRFSPSIPLPIIFAEQRQMRRLYPDKEE